MKARIITPSELGSSEIARWQALRGDDFFFQNPFYSPRFTQLMGELRSDVRVAVVEDAGQVIGFFAYHKSPLGFATGLGTPVSNAQGPILSKDTDLDLEELVHMCGLDGYAFSNLTCGERVLDRAHCHVATNYMIDLIDGADRYLDARRTLHPKTFKTFDYQRRRAERNYGAVTEVFDDRSPEAHTTLRRLKSGQYRRTRSHDILSSRWISGLFDRMASERDPDFYGLLTTVRFGDQIAASNLDFVSGPYNFGWLTAYNRTYKDAAPGNLLTLALFPGYAQRGDRFLDFGVDYGYYKGMFANIEAPILSGFVAGTSRRGVAYGAVARQIHRGVYGDAGRPLRALSRLWSSASYVAACEANPMDFSMAMLARITSRFHKGD
jgi:CelD/BcsL family acetyltransferase involved in cellulose biosynthesis